MPLCTCNEGPRCQMYNGNRCGREEDEDPFLAQMGPSPSERRDRAVEGCAKFAGIMALVFVVAMTVVISVSIWWKSGLQYRP